MTISKELQGYIKIRITGYSPERFLNSCKYKEIEIWGLTSKPAGYEMYMKVQDFRKLKPLLRKTRTRITVLERCGAPFFMHRYRKRKILFIGAALCVLMVFFFSRYIWRIEINGNQSITDQVLLEYLESEKTFHGMKIKDVLCEEIVTNIRKQFPEIIWVSASIDGCNLIVDVRETTDTFQVGQTEQAPGDIVATADGIVTEIITRSGVPCVEVGDEVSAGDVLVSGAVEVLNDAGEIVRTEYVVADSDIFAEVKVSYDDICEKYYQKKEYQKSKYKQWYLNVGNLHMAVGFPKSKKKQYELQANQRQLIFNESFRLPVSYGIQSGKTYLVKKAEYSKPEILAILDERYDWFCRELEGSNVVILEENIEKTDIGEGIRYSGFLKVRQSIGTLRKSVDFSHGTMLE